MEQEEVWPWRQTPAGTLTKPWDLGRGTSPPDLPLLSQGKGSENAGRLEACTTGGMTSGGPSLAGFFSVVVDTLIVC